MAGTSPTIVRAAIVGAALVVAGCGGVQASGNKVLHPSAEDKSAVEAALRAYGVAEPVVAIQNRGDYWTATVESAPVGPASPGMQTLAPPTIYHVYRDGKVVDPRTNKPLKK